MNDKDIVMNLLNIFFNRKLMILFPIFLSVLLVFSLNSSYCTDCKNVDNFIEEINKIEYNTSEIQVSLTITNNIFNNIDSSSSIPVFKKELDDYKCNNIDKVEKCWKNSRKAKELGLILAGKCNQSPDRLSILFYLDIIENIYFQHFLPCNQKSAMVIMYYFFLKNLSSDVLKILTDDIDEIERIQKEYENYFDNETGKMKSEDYKEKYETDDMYNNYELFYMNLSKIQKHLLQNLYKDKNTPLTKPLFKHTEPQKEKELSEPKEDELKQQTEKIQAEKKTSPSESHSLTEGDKSDKISILDFETSIFKDINSNHIFRVLFSFIMLTILAFLLRVNYINKQMIKKFDTINKNINRDPVSNKLAVLIKDVELLKDTDKYSSSIQTITKSLDDLHSLFQQSISEIKRLIKSFQSIYKKQSEKKSKSEDVVDTIYAQEKDILSESWDKFYQKHEQNTKIANEIAMSETYVFFKEVTTNLEKQLSSNKTLEENFTKALTGLKDSIKFVLRMAHFSDKKNIIKHTKTKNEQNIRQMREITSRLNYYKEQDFNISDAFKPLIWVRERFLDFADSFYHEYQKQLLKNEHQALTEAKSSVTEILQKANIKIIEIELGATQFDSKIHIARSTETNISYPNNVIMRVIRNGFSYISNGKFIQQPEVIVNKR